MQLLFNNRAVRENKIGADEHERGSGSSDHTLSNGNNDIKGGNSKGDGGESGDDGSQPPVGFWDKGLRKTRNGVFLQWGKTSEFLTYSVQRNILDVDLSSYNTFHCHTRNPLPLLGRAIQRRDEPELIGGFCRRF